MKKKTIQNFDLNQIAASGQCFRMTQCIGEPDSYTVVSGCHFLKIHQQENDFTFHCSDEDLTFWEQYFDLHTDYASFLDSIDSCDQYLQKAAEFGNGIRILVQDTWEMIITFVISQQKTIPAIRGLVEELCLQYGTKLTSPYAPCGYYYAFPSPDQLNRASLDDLLTLKLGYRAKYIKQLCEDACSGVLDLKKLERLSYRDSMEYLQGFYGIGEKVANCVCLFGLHHIDAFPVDTWIKKILLREYAQNEFLESSSRGEKEPLMNQVPDKKTAGHIPQSRFYEALVQKHFSKYHGCAGVMQQYIFYYERVVINNKSAF